MQRSGDHILIYYIGTAVLCSALRGSLNGKRSFHNDSSYHSAVIRIRLLFYLDDHTVIVITRELLNFDDFCTGIQYEYNII